MYRLFTLIVVILLLLFFFLSEKTTITMKCIAKMLISNISLLHVLKL